MYLKFLCLADVVEKKEHNLESAIFLSSYVCVCISMCVCVCVCVYVCVCC